MYNEGFMYHFGNMQFCDKIAFNCNEGPDTYMIRFACSDLSIRQAGTV